MLSSSEPYVSVMGQVTEGYTGIRREFLCVNRLQTSEYVSFIIRRAKYLIYIQFCDLKQKSQRQPKFVCAK